MKESCSSVFGVVLLSWHFDASWVSALFRPRFEFSPKRLNEILDEAHQCQWTSGVAGRETDGRWGR